MEDKIPRYPKLHVIEPTGEHTHTFIFLHGRGDKGTSFAEEILSYETSEKQKLATRLPNWRWVFPTALTQWNAGFRMMMPAWIDVASLSDINYRQDLQIQGLRESTLYTISLLLQEIERLDGKTENVVLGGLSQGMSVAMWALLCAAGKVKGRLGGVVGACGYLPFSPQIQEVVYDYKSKASTETNQGGCLLIPPAAFLELVAAKPRESKPEEVEAVLSTPVLLLHGTDDRIVNVSLGRAAGEVFMDMGLNVKRVEYSGAENNGHWLKVPEGLDAIVAFFERHTK